MTKTLMIVLAVTAVAACAAAATTISNGPSESQIVDQVTNRLAEASAAVAAPAVPPVVAPAPAPAVEAAQYVAPAPVAAPVERIANADLRCEVRATPTANGVRLNAIAHASAPTSGSYELIVTKSGSDGSSDISQSGEFDTASSPSADLGTAEIGLEPGARFHARLVVHGAGGVSCRDELRS